MENKFPVTIALSVILSYPSPLRLLIRATWPGSAAAYLTNLAMHEIGHRSLLSIIILCHPGMILAGVTDGHEKIWIPAQSFA